MPAPSVLITGASTGIGAATALWLDHLGMHVIAGVRRQRDAASLCNRASERLSTLLLDVTDSAAVAAAGAAVAAQVGDAGLWGLVNNAGIAVAGPLEYLPIEQFREQLEVNLTGALAVTQVMLPLLRRACGRIVNISSVSGLLASPLVGAYAASKFGLEAVSDALRVELAPWGIRVAVIEPGVIKTPIWETSRKRAEGLYGRLGAEAVRRYGPMLERLAALTAQSVRHGAEPEAVAQAVSHALTSRRPRTRYLVGADARAVPWLRRLPDATRDCLLRRGYLQLHRLDLGE